jgi:hypothetical protein
MDPTLLRSIPLFVTHGGCPDGRAAALVVNAVLPRVPIREIAYNSPEHLALRPADRPCFLDFSPHRDHLASFVCPAGAAGYTRGDPGAIVIDHHAADLVTPFGELGVHGSNTLHESGAFLSYREVFAPLFDGARESLSQPEAVRGAARQLARLAAIRDTWQTDHPQWEAACEVSEFLRQTPLTGLLRFGVVTTLHLGTMLGPCLWQRKREQLQATADNAVRIRVGGVRVAVFPSREGAEDAADLVKDADMVAAFDYVHEDGGRRVRLQWSLRSWGAVNCAAIARQCGGGGHPSGRAAGFSEVISDGSFPAGSPYTRLADMLHAALAAERPPVAA